MKNDIASMKWNYSEQFGPKKFLKINYPGKDSQL